MILQKIRPAGNPSYLKAGYPAGHSAFFMDKEIFFH